jgi:hypothetical protein
LPAVVIDSVRVATASAVTMDIRTAPSGGA